MRTTKVRQGQSFFDVVIESTGDITNAFEMALVNNISVTDIVFNQMDLIVAGTEKRAITQLFLHDKVATEYTSEQIVPNTEGIGYWLINIDFIVQ